MASDRIIPDTSSLSPVEKSRLIESLSQDLARADSAPLILPNQSYPVWSPDLAFSAAAILLQVLSAGEGGHDLHSQSQGTAMNDEEIESRLLLIKQIHTPKRMWYNEVVAVGSTNVTVHSNKPGTRDRGIPYADIRRPWNPEGENSRILFSLRQILGLGNGVTSPPAEEDE